MLRWQIRATGKSPTAWCRRGTCCASWSLLYCVFWAFFFCSWLRRSYILCVRSFKLLWQFSYNEKFFFQISAKNIFRFWYKRFWITAIKAEPDVPPRSNGGLWNCHHSRIRKKLIWFRWYAWFKSYCNFRSKISRAPILRCLYGNCNYVKLAHAPLTSF